ncbi:TonB-dependent receptor [Mucilaginibacter pedocola]|uniref:TonB-dependent transporter Oar-like beta-barrel domain-containing protein n=1 Tax=Mucilaginibacter pedocola TaxID=1792845 RepID=A0A1S9P9Y0_9SPHI|nr:TonB-dependent receptor [Mucilaginibacter pedocola]OOQ57784.1 hypothetical protein BC343_13435 [Mucilaginibacter pedocola]
MKTKCFLFMAMLTCRMLCGYHALYAQTTKSSLEGAVVAGGSPVAGASIRLLYIPTATEYGSATNDRGFFYLPEVKPGGPYELEVTHTGYDRYTIKDLYLKLAEAKSLEIVLSNSTRTLPEVVINADADEGKLLTAQTGPRLYMANRQIQAQPNIRRSITDLLKLVPQAFGNAIAGGNYRQNFITVDGSEFNNNFGVGDNLPGYGAQPIALDAIDQLTVSIAPYNSIWESGFIGGAINIITRSGDNKIRASVYSYFRNQDMYGYRVGEAQLAKRPVSFHLNGFRIGGPLIKNKLFYFLSLEAEREIYDPQVLTPSTPAAPYGSSPNVARPTAQELGAINEYLLTNYGYNAGPNNGYTFKNTSSRVLLRLDWNIATNHTLTLRYNQLNSLRPELVNGSRSPLTAFPMGAGRRSNNALPFGNSNFSTRSNFYSLAAEWNFPVAPGLFNTARVSFTRQDEPRETASTVFPFVDILKDGSPFTSFGFEPFTYGNSRDISMLSAANYLHGSGGKHNWQAGLQADYSRTENTYMPFGTGYYTFASWNDFATGQKPVDYAVTYSIVPGREKPSYSFIYTNFALFGQDHFTINDGFELTGAMRLDLPAFPKPLANNTLASSLEFAGGQRLFTSQLPKPAFLFSPRLSFNWDMDEFKTIRLRGGTGIFTGRIPFVWIISQARYSGINQVTQTWQGQQNTPGPFNPDPKAYVPAVTPATGTFLPSNISVLSPDFKMPQSWKSSLGLDVRLPGGLKGTAEVLYNRDINTIVFKDVNLVQPQRLNIPGYPDNRLVYPSAINQRFIHPLNTSGYPDPAGNAAFNAVLINNASRGYYWSVTTGIEKQWDNHWSASATFIKSMAKSLNDGDGDQTLSALTATPTVNGINQPELSYAGYVSPSRIIGSLNYQSPLGKNLQISAAVFYQGAIDGRFSYTYARDLVNDGTNRSLLYVPRDASEITFSPIINNVTGRVAYTAEQQEEAFFKFIEQDNYLRTRKGRYAERNGATLPWRSQLDAKLAIKTHFKHNTNKHALEFTVDLLNAGNLLNPNWGLRKLVNANALLIPVNLNAVKPGGTTRPEFQLATIGGKLVSETFRNDVSLNSTYTIQFGVRYSFN